MVTGTCNFAFSRHVFCYPLRLCLRITHRGKMLTQIHSTLDQFTRSHTSDTSQLNSITTQYRPFPSSKLNLPLQLWPRLPHHQASLSPTSWISQPTKNCNGVASDAAVLPLHQPMSHPTGRPILEEEVVAGQHPSPIPSPGPLSRTVLGPCLRRGSRPERSIRRSRRT